MAEPTTLLELTESESRLLRNVLSSGGMSDVSEFVEALTAYNRGVIRGTERLKAEQKNARGVVK